MMELSRNKASGHVDWDRQGHLQHRRPLVGRRPGRGHASRDPITIWHPDDYGRVNPFNPCLPVTVVAHVHRHPVTSAPARRRSTTRPTGIALQ